MPEPVDLENSLLVMQFRQFCGEVLHLRDALESAPGTPAPSAEAEQAASAPPSPAAAAMAAAVAASAAATAAAVAAANSAMAGLAEPPPVPPPAAGVFPDSFDLLAARRDEGRQRLLNLLEQQTYQSMALGGSYGIANLREAQYVMAALADESAALCAVAGRGGWRLLEEELFHSHASGDIFFQRLDALLKQGEAGSAELAPVFFGALALNFRGRYRNSDPHKILSRYRRQLFLRLFRRSPEDSSGGPVFAQAYEVAPPAEEYRRLANPHRWWFAVGAVVLLWLLATTVAWQVLTGDLHRQLQRIDRIANWGGARR